MFQIASIITAVVLFVATLIWPVGGGIASIATTLGVGLAAYGFMVAMRPEADLLSHPFLDEVRRKYWLALRWPWASADLSRALSSLQILCVLTIPIELWKGTWWLGVLGALPWIALMPAVMRLSPWHFLGNSTDPRAILELTALKALTSPLASESQ